LLAHVQIAARRSYIAMPEPGSVRRFVFVCQGNICRSAFAERVARDLGGDSISFGLSTSADDPAHPPAMRAAASLGVDLSAHRTSRVQDYVPQPGDFLLAMEVRQLARLAENEKLRHLPRALLGRWSTPARPHLHDPFGLDAAYMITCLRSIETAVAALVRAYPSARLSERH
jgi:protein-tyrosine phosphatase